MVKGRGSLYIEGWEEQLPRDENDDGKGDLLAVISLCINSVAQQILTLDHDYVHRCMVPGI